MKKYEFISFKEYPEGQYPTAIATVRINLKDENGYPVREVVRYARKEMKNGGQFWAMATHSVLVNGEKRYLPGYKSDSDLDEDQLVDFIKANVKNYTPVQVQMQQSVHAANAPTPPEFPPMSEVSPNDMLPF